MDQDNQENIYYSKSEMSFNLPMAPMLSKSASEQNVYLMYVCLVNHGIPTMSHVDMNEKSANQDADEENGGEIPKPIQVERSKAVHELVESTMKNDQNLQNKPTTSSEDSEVSDLDDFNKYEDPKVLKLTKMKWLSEDQSGYPDSSTPSVSSARSTTSSKAEDSDDIEVNHKNVGEKCLSTILRLDKEHNLFGLSSIAIIGSKQSRSTKQTRKDDEKAVFHQTAIVQVCCKKSCSGCCKHQSTTDLPSSLKGAGCGYIPCMSVCRPPPYPCSPCPSPCPPPPPLSCQPTCLSSCVRCSPVPPPTCALIPRNPQIHVTCLPEPVPTKSRSSWKISCCDADAKPPSLCALPCSTPCPRPPPCSDPLPPCLQQCTCGLTAFLPPEPEDCCFGLRLKLNRKPKFDPPVIEITPRGTSLLTQPEMARCCSHNPPCQPPTLTYPYLMPCYWPSRPSAPCSHPESCFHNPPCLPLRRERGPIPHEQRCPKPGPCIQCSNKSCLGINKEFIKGLEIWSKLKQQPQSHGSSPPGSTLKPMAKKEKDKKNK